MSTVLSSTVLSARRSGSQGHRSTAGGSAIHFSTRWCGPTTVVSAHGELDASNAAQFTDYVLRGDLTRLVVDLSGVDFIGTAGYSALHIVNVRCAAEQGSWALIPSSAVHRLLRVCDHDCVMPVCAGIDEALGLLDTGSRLLKLVPKAR